VTDRLTSEGGAEADHLRDRLESLRLQFALLDVINGGAWGEIPAVTADALRTVLAVLLMTVVKHDPSRLAWAMEVIDGVRAAVLADVVVHVVPDPSAQTH
jgi:hypothetical protein